GGHSAKGRPRWGHCQRLLELQTVLVLIEVLLLSNVPANLFLIETHGTDAVTTSPEMQTREIPLMAQQLPMDTNRALALEKPDHHRDAVPRRNTQTHVNVIHHCLPLDHFGSVSELM